MACSRCGAATVGGQKYCFQCGEPLGVACAACGTAVAPGARFCGECGRPVDAPAPRGEGGHPTPERRLVSVLFADLVGFTSLAEHRDPEEVRNLLSRYSDLSRSLATRYGGTVEKFIGDAVMAVWGSPVAHEDDAERAVRTALDLVPAVGRLGDEVGFPGLAIRVGVATGEAAVLIDAPGEGMVAGDLVNTASRIEESAGPGCVLVNESTYRAARRAVAFDPAGRLELRGKDEAVEVYRATRPVAAPGEPPPAELLPPFVGRSAELRLLVDLFDRCAGDGRGHLVSIMGIAGIGKSRLVSELERALADRGASTTWHHGRSPAYGEGATFRALAQIVRRSVGIDEADGPESAMAKVTRTVERSVPPDDRHLVEQGLATLLDLPGGGGLDADQLFASWRRLFEAQAADHPVVLVFEDLQWADAGLLDFVESLMLWSRHVPVFVVTLARPELLDRRPSWGVGQAAFTAIQLEPLPGTEVRVLIRELVPGMPPEALDAIVDRAEGIPLYAIETVRMLLDTGMVIERGGRYEPSGTSLGSLAVPETLHALVAARLDALEPEDRRLVQRAAVLGTTVSPKPLAAIAGLDPGEVERRLSALVTRRVFDADLDPHSSERGRFRFVQTVTREVALATLARSERRELHLRVAAHFEQLGDDRALPVIAHHLTEALAASPGGDPRLQTRTVAALDRAAGRAAVLGAHEQELAFLERAEDLAPDEDEACRLAEQAMHAATQAGLYRRAITHAERAAAHHREGGDAEAEALVAGPLAHLLSMEGRVAEAEAIVDDATDRLSGGISDRAIARLEAQRARLRLFQEDADGGAAAVERAAAAANRSGDVATIIDSMVTRGWAFGAMGRTLEFWGITAGALDLAVTHGDVEAEGRARNNLATLAWGDPHRGEEIVEEGIVRFRERGHLAHVLTMMTRAIGLAIGLGRWERAEELLADPLREGASVWVQNQLYAFDTLLWSFRGDWQRANAAYARLRELLAGAEIAQDRAFLLSVDRSMAEARGDHRRALEAATAAFETSPDRSEATFATLGALAIAAGEPDRARDAVRRLAEASMRSERGDAHRRALEGILAIGAGAVDDGLAEARDAISTLRRLDLPMDTATLEGELAVSLPVSHPAREDAAAAARAIWDGLGARALRAVLDGRLETP